VPRVVQTIEPLTGVVTARQLEAVTGAVVHLAPGARLTPLAADFVKENKLTIERTTANHPITQSPNRQILLTYNHNLTAPQHPGTFIPDHVDIEAAGKVHRIIHNIDSKFRGGLL